MGQILHPTATTTHRVRKEIQTSDKTLKELAATYNISYGTAQKWRKREQVEDVVSGRKKGEGSVLTEVEEGVICEVRTKTWLPLDDLYMLLKPHIAVLSRSNLHRCLQRNGISRLPVLEGEQRAKKEFKKYEPGYVHIDTFEVKVGKEKHYGFVAVDRCTKYVYVELHDNKEQLTAKAFLENVLADFPFKISKILTDNGVEYTHQYLPQAKRPQEKVHPFDRVCQQHTIEHRLTLIKHPWTNGQVEAINKKIKENTVRKYQYDSVEQLKEHLYFYILDYNFNKKLKALNFHTPYEIIIQKYQQAPQLFHHNPVNKFVGRNN
jgi:transposase-like protein